MKIQDQTLAGAAAETQRGHHVHGTGKSSGTRSTQDASSYDQVEFSGTLGALSRALSTSDADRSARVNSLAEQYRNGTFRVDSAAISRGMISEALDAGLR